MIAAIEMAHDIGDNILLAESVRCSEIAKEKKKTISIRIIQILIENCIDV